MINSISEKISHFKISIIKDLITCNILGVKDITIPTFIEEIKKKTNEDPIPDKSIDILEATFFGSV